MLNISKNELSRYFTACLNSTFRIPCYPHGLSKFMLYDVVMGHFISRWLILTVAAGVMVAFLPGMHAIGEPPVLGVAAFALFMALINASIKPIIHIIALPLSIISFGLVALVINWLFMQLASWLALSFFSVGVTIDGFVWSVLGSLVMTIVSGIVGGIIGD